jgi:cell filamentation protein
MELSVLDAFGDYETRGYLRNFFQEKDLKVVAGLEAAAFKDHVRDTVRYLRCLQTIRYEHVAEAHRRLFDSVYPWAGQDRSQNASEIAIVKGGDITLFARPADVRRAAEYALELGKDASYLREHPGEVLGYLAHSHPFLEGNGRTILTIFAELCRRARFHIEWEAVDQTSFLDALTDELLHPASAMDKLLTPYLRAGVLSLESAAAQLSSNFNPPQ